MHDNGSCFLIMISSEIVNETVDRRGNTRNNIRSMNTEEEKAKEKLTKRGKLTKKKRISTVIYSFWYIYL